MTCIRNEAGGKQSRRRLSGLTVCALAVAGLLSVSACDTGELLDVQTPDIIDPSDVESPAGANAVRVGALARFTQATTGAESFIILGGLFADEWINGDTFTDRHEIDQRRVLPGNSFLTTATRNLHRGRLSAAQAVHLIGEYLPNAPGWQSGEMYMIQAYLMNLAGEAFCNGIPFSEVAPDGTLTYGTPITTEQTFQEALALTDQGLSVTSGSTADGARVQNALQVLRGRILMNLDQPSQAASAVASVPDDYGYAMYHSSSAFSNAHWEWNVLTRRYSVSDAEGQNGINFATAGDPRVPVCEAPCLDIGVDRDAKDDASQPLHVQLLWPHQESTIPLIQGVDARMLEAEAALRAGNAEAAMTILNTARTTVGLEPLDDPGSAQAREDLLFREKAFWTFGRGYRMGDLRRLVRQYGRDQASVFPTGDWHKGGATYHSDVNMPIPLAESNNPNVGDNLCFDRDP
jgi:starch-binding outer membrane protein, SusD/RagB family